MVDVLLSGVNFLVVGDGLVESWELLQFCDVVLIGLGVWEILIWLCGQFGIDVFMFVVWLVGSKVVLLDGVVVQVDLFLLVCNQLWYWWIGFGICVFDDVSYCYIVVVFWGVGLWLLMLCYLSVDGNMVSWICRICIQGDGWDGFDVFLGEV